RRWIACGSHGIRRFCWSGNAFHIRARIENRNARSTKESTSLANVEALRSFFENLNGGPSVVHERLFNQSGIKESSPCLGGTWRAAAVIDFRIWFRRFDRPFKILVANFLLAHFLGFSIFSARGRVYCLRAIVIIRDLISR